MKILILISITLIVFYINNEFSEGSAKNEIELSNEIQAPADSLYLWEISTRAPFKYRLLHKSIVLGSFYLLSPSRGNHDFFIIYKIWSFIFLAGAAIAFYFFLLHLKFTESYSFWGTILFLSCAPIMMAFSWPVHTREDTLGYILLLMGLSSIIRDKPILVLTFSLLGVLCRETLLVIPFVYLLFSNKQKLSVRMLIASIPIITFILIRLFVKVDGYYGTGPLEGLKWNLSNIKQILGFTYLTFGALWIPFFHNLLKEDKQNDSGAFMIIRKSAPYALFLIAGSSFAFGVLNEIRLLFLAFPWIVSMTLLSFKQNKIDIISFMKNKLFKYYLLFLILFIVILAVFVLNNFENYYGGSAYNVPFDSWIIVGIGNIFFTLIILPIYTGLYLER